MEHTTCTGNCGSCSVRCYLNKNVPIVRDYISLSLQAHEPREGFGLAVDLGTTTVAMELIDLQNGKTVAGYGFENPQRAFGSDVISRIQAANEGQAVALRQCICTAIIEHTSKLLRGRELAQAVISANTTMAYLLLGYECACLGMVPFEPRTQLNNPYIWGGIFGGAGSCPVFVVPFISAYVGGDIVSGLLNVPRNNSFLLVDLGTNGEIALGHAGKLYATATAAGPAFEGLKPGLCASDVLNTMAKLLREECIDETGYMENDECHGFTQRDVRHIQLAKSAVRSGIEILQNIAGRPEIDTVYLCGGFGKSLDEQSALDIGLFPKSLHGKIIALGNSSLGGAVRLLKNPDAQHEIPAIVAAQHVNLSEQRSFNDYFMEHMGF